MKKIFKTGIVASLLLLVVVFSGYYIKTAVGGIVSTASPAVQAGTFRTYDFFASSTAPSTIATSTSATSTNITPYFTSAGTYDDGSFSINGAKKVTVYFTRGDVNGTGNTGHSTFRLQITPDGTNWYDWDRLAQNVATTTNAMATSTVTLTAGTTTRILGMDFRYETFKAMRCVVVEATDGSHQCRASAEW